MKGCSWFVPAPWARSTPDGPDPARRPETRPSGQLIVVVVAMSQM